MRLLPLILILAFASPPAGRALAASPEDLVRRGNDLYRGEKFDEAAQAYREALQRNPSSPLILYNLGTALARNGETEPAEEALGQAARNPTSPLRRDAWFNTGVVQAEPVIDKMSQEGGGAAMIQTPQDTRQQVEQLEKALGSFRQAILADSSDSYAIYNYEIVKEALEALRQQQNQQNQENKDQNQNQDQKKDQDQNKDQQQDQQNQDQQNQGDEGDKGQEQQQEQKPEEGKSERKQQQPGEQGEEKEQQRQQQGMEGAATPTPRPEPPTPKPAQGGGEAEPPKLTPEQMDALRLLNLLEDESPEQFKRLFRFRGDSAPRPGRDW